MVDRLDELVNVGVGNVTVTLNALKPEIGEKIYSFIVLAGRTYRGREGAQILIERQLAGIESAVKKGLTVKVNTVLIRGINGRHLPEIAKRAKVLGVYVQNIMLLIPQHLFAHVTPPTPEERKHIQDKCAKILPQMRHCRQCRADAVGKLNEELYLPGEGNKGKSVKVAVATSGSSGLVDLHFGHTRTFFVYEADPKTLSFQFLEERQVKEGYCKGPECDNPLGQEDVLEDIVNMLRDCKFVVCRRIGTGPASRLKKAGIKPVEDWDNIDNVIRKILMHHLT